MRPRAMFNGRFGWGKEARLCLPSDKTRATSVILLFAVRSSHYVLRRLKALEIDFHLFRLQQMLALELPTQSRVTLITSKVTTSDPRAMAKWSYSNLMRRVT
jgi:hypothetical protein